MLQKGKNCADYGSFVISLDFELMWGILDRSDPMDYKDNVLGAWDVIPKMLRLFEKHHIHATWGVVGMIANKSIEECVIAPPKRFPDYADKNLSSYSHLDELKGCDTRYIFAPELIKKIADTKYQEIGSHTYSHYYCSEEGQSGKAFQCDLAKAREALKPYKENVKSLILPRNQINKEYMEVIRTEGFVNYRGHETMWIYEPCGVKKSKGIIRRILRLADHYICLSGHNCYGYDEIKDDNGLNNIKSSRFFRPYSKVLSFLEPLRMHRIKSQMKYAATHHMVFHMWWHPHNFGVNKKENFRNLVEIINYFELLREKYGMKSLNMGEVGEICT